ncbi:hypothetical protein MWU38_04205 [Qipengyuania sp. S6317L1]|uniref:hypothetical protein n=1 Tax=Qipengyuania sp. S6317L1 TaxID=2926410 RepID=UPI001FF632A5|nr:hypothetical protein [Qipengyuania sp. S6317L1]MCK0098573.1 hypothetical protein [Qipengyuania sp. S6317L1]
MNGALEWTASIGTILAAGLIALDISRKVTGWGFVLFCVVSSLWIVSGFIEDAMPIAVMNGVLLIINAWGVWRYMLNPARNAQRTSSLQPME